MFGVKSKSTPCSAMYTAIPPATLFADSRAYKTFDKGKMEYFLLHRHRHADIVIFTQQWDALDRKIRCITDRVYYVCKGWLTGKWLTSVYRVPYGILFPEGEKKGEIVQGYNKPPLLYRLFAKRIYRPRYYKYFDSFDLDPLPALPKQYGAIPQEYTMMQLLKLRRNKRIVLLRSFW